jgi:type I restriction enzyme S subunit
MRKTLPNNWVETKAENLFNLVYGKGLAVKDLTDDGYLVYGANGIIGKYSSYTYEKSKVIISCRGAASGAIHKTKPFSFITSNSIVLDEVSESIVDLFFIKYVMTYVDKSEIITGTAQPQITIQLLNKLQIPLPPLPEQERIANKLDALFSQLDGIRAAMERIPTLLKNFRQQVLTQAVTGKLTNVDPQKRYLKELLLDVKYGTSKKSDYGIDGIPVLRIPNINEGEINLNDLKYTIFEEKEYEQLKLKDGDVLIIRSNGSISLVGQTAIVRKKHEGYSYAGYLIRMRCNQDLDPEFLNFSLRSGFVRSQIIDLAHSTSGVNNINAEQIKGLKICWFSIPEQQEIVHRVENLFSQADVIEQQYKSLKQKIDNLPQAILHKAFKGELVEQFPTDGDAHDLLRQIEKLKESTKKK